MTAPDTSPTKSSSRKPPGRVRSTIVKVKDRSQQVREVIEAARPRSATIDTGFRIADRDRNIGGGVMAGALAYRLFLWLLPFALVLIGILGLVGQLWTGSAVEIASSVGVGAYVARSVAESSSTSPWAAVLLGGFALYWASSGAFKTVRIIHLFAWQLPITPPRRSPLGALHFFLATTGLLLLTSLANRLRELDGMPGLLPGLLLIPVTAAAWVFVSSHLPRRDGVRWTGLLPGALVVAFGSQLVHIVAVIYLAPKLSRSSEVYGALGTAAVLLLWIYIISRLVVAAAELNAVFWQRRHDGSGGTRPQELKPAEQQPRAG